MVTQVKSTVKIERIPGTKLVRLLEDFWFYSVVLGRWCCIPAGFIYDEESVPILKGSNPEAGLIHDYLCRKDSDPVVDKLIAAKVYYEFQKYYNSLDEETALDDVWDFIKSHVKRDAVIVAIGYFHKLTVNAPLEEVRAAL